MNRLAGKIVDRGEPGRRGSSHDDFDHALSHRVGKVDALRALGGDREVAGRDVALAVQESRQELLARGRQRDHADRPVLELVLLVEPDLEVLQRIGHQPALRALVVEVQRAAVRHQHAHHAALEHAVEVSLPRLKVGIESGHRRRAGRVGEEEKEKKLHRFGASGSTASTQPPPSAL